jgi:hypothetical protein
MELVPPAERDLQALAAADLSPVQITILRQRNPAGTLDQREVRQVMGFAWPVCTAGSQQCHQYGQLISTANALPDGSVQQDVGNRTR